MAGISPISGAAGSQQTAASASNSQLSSSDFLSLLTTELQNQDPMNPVDDTQSVAQLAQFSALSATEEMDQSFQAFQSNFGVMQSASLIGKTVTVSTPQATGNNSTVTGTVASIEVQNGLPYFTMNNSSGQPITDNSGNPLMFSTSEIVGIGN
ncbi:MAG TPA: flagellar hook capping FlgD N-terminal domain-containing protein [Candidatus Baltobacteraceae bacterium]|nr:flagellar hook capping FlgD N-terminal domain-containing protein [Candidatus Baltobacteraceae bacterium]